MVVNPQEWGVGVGWGNLENDVNIQNRKTKQNHWWAFIWYFLAPISKFSICVFNNCEIIYNVMKEYIEQLQFDSITTFIVNIYHFIQIILAYYSLNR